MYMHALAGASATDRSTIIEVNNLVKRYGTLTAVDGISFSVKSGETFGLLGPNGAGKTTTMEMLEGIRSPSSGHITIQGLDVVKESRRIRSMIGVQLQEAGFFEKLTVKETIDAFGRFFKQAVPTQRLLEQLQLEEKARSLVENLSGGQRQRLSIALALVNDPQIVFLDEPTTGLDPQARRNLWDTIRTIQSEGRTIILTTHYMDEAEELCDRIAIVDSGQIIALDTPGALIQTHAPGVKIYVTLSQDETVVPSEVWAALPAVDQVVPDSDTEVALYSQQFETTIDALIQKGRAGEVRYKSLRVEASNLEDVFLKLTGKQLRE